MDSSASSACGDGWVRISLDAGRDALAAALETGCLPRYAIPSIPTSMIDFGY